MNEAKHFRNKQTYKKKLLSFVRGQSLTQCMPNDKATAFALILEANISGRRRAGTGPAPSENDNTQLLIQQKQSQVSVYDTINNKKKESLIERIMQEIRVPRKNLKIEVI